MTLKLHLLAALTGISLLTLPANAGGPVLIVEDAYEAEPVPKLTPGEKIALAAGLLVLGAFIIGNGGGSDCTCNDQPDDGGGACGC